MTAPRAAFKASPATVSSGIVPATPELADRGDGSVSAAAFSAQHPRAANPFASLKQEQTVEAKVNAQLLTLTKGVPMGGAARVYEVPDELLALARRNRPADTRSTPPASVATRGALEPSAATPAITPPAPGHSFNWLAVSLVAYALICVTYWFVSQ